jgi:hypothetical protein
VVPSEPVAPPAGDSPSPAVTATAAAVVAPTEPTDAAPAEPPVDTPPAIPEPPALLDVDGKLLPQNEDRPAVAEPLFEHRMALLFRAIVENDPEIARSFFFPLAAYEKVKAIADPNRDWNRRLWKLFVRDIHDYHRELGDDPAKAKLERFELRERDVQWVKPHREGNALGYWRVRRSKLYVTTGAGQSKRLDLTAMISWRGHWHVVHLHGFK